MRSGVTFVVYAAALGLAVPLAWAEGDICATETPLLSKATLQAMQTAAATYQQIVDNGGWVAVPMQSMQVGAVSANVRLLRLRLMREGDLAPTSKLSNRFDDEVTVALRHFQARYGLPETGILDQYTLRTMNVPARERLAWLQADILRLRKYLAALPASPRQVTVNLPAAEVEAVEHGRVAERYRAVAGAAEHPSPELQSRITAVDYNPTWTVPPSIVKHDILPLMRDDPTYLTRANFTVFDARGRTIDPARIDWRGDDALRYTYRQAPGAGNPMGDIKLYMPNPDDVYMHDTPRRLLFERGIRFLSAGCVRVQDIARLAAWLRGSDSKPKASKVSLAQPVPVNWVYMPAWSTPAGVTCFRPDIYKKMNDAAAR
jgi:murein L,D-transpeptidase YcbB/YkuD